MSTPPTTSRTQAALRGSAEGAMGAKENRLSNSMPRDRRHTGAARAELGCAIPVYASNVHS